MFAEDAVAVAGDQAIAQIANWQWDEPEERTENLPTKAQLPEDPHGSRRSAKGATFDQKDHRTEIACFRRGQQLASCLALERRELEVAFPITSQHEVDGFVAQAANTVEEEYATSGFGGAVHGGHINGIDGIQACRNRAHDLLLLMTSTLRIVADSRSNGQGGRKRQAKKVARGREQMSVREAESCLPTFAGFPPTGNFCEFLLPRFWILPYNLIDWSRVSRCDLSMSPVTNVLLRLSKDGEVMASLNRSLWSVGTACLLTWSLSGCGGASSSVPVVNTEGSDTFAGDEEMSSGLPTVAIPGPKPAASKATKAAAAAAPAASKGATTKATAAQPAPAAAAMVEKEPEKGSPEWLLLEIQHIRTLPLPGAVDDLGENDDDDKDPTPEEEAALRKQLDQQRSVRRERNFQIIKLAEECIAKTNKKPELEDYFDMAVHHLLDARLQLALQGDATSIDALFEAATVFHERKPGSVASLEAQMTLVNLTHANALRYGRAEPKWIQEFAKHSQLFAARFPEEQGRAVPLLFAAARSCELNGLPEEAKSCYSLLLTKFKDTPQAQQAQGVVRRLQLKGKTLELAGPTMDGGEIDIESYRGKMVLVVFWASHAQPFVQQLPKLTATIKKYEKYAAVIGVNLDAEEPAVEAFLEKTGLTWPQIFSPNREQRGWSSPLASHYGINNLPTIWLVDPNGVVAETAIDAENLEAKLREVYLPYLKATSVKPAGGTK